MGDTDGPGETALPPYFSRLWNFTKTREAYAKQKFS